MALLTANNGRIVFSLRRVHLVVTFGGVPPHIMMPRDRRVDPRLIGRSIATNILPRNGLPCRLDRGHEARAAYPSRQTKGTCTISARGCAVNRKMDKLTRAQGVGRKQVNPLSAGHAAHA